MELEAVEKKIKVTPSLLTAIIVLKNGLMTDLNVSLHDLYIDKILNYINFFVIDAAIHPTEAIKLFCLQHDCGYIHIPSFQNEEARLRNFGASLASSEYIIQHPAATIQPLLFYQTLCDEITLHKLDADSSKFIAVPIIQSSLGDSSLSPGKDLPDSFAFLVNRHHYLAMGGYNEYLSGQAMEKEYAYRLFATGDLVWSEQLLLSGQVKQKPDRYAQIELLTCLKRFEAIGHQLPPLPAFERGRSLMLGRLAFANNRALIPLWGELVLEEPKLFDHHDIIEYVKHKNINRVLFDNPYVDEAVNIIYQRVRAAGIAYYVIERGALTDSMFIDPTGFCCESTLYKREHWPAELSKERFQRVTQYIEQETSSSSALEKQAKRVGGDELRRQFGLAPTQKILFVPFQSRADTTVNHFAGAIGSYDNFVVLVREVADKLPSGWVLIFKNHPLSDVTEEVPGAIDAGAAHIKDILSVTDCTLLMNSGVGVLSILFNVPCLYTAQAFYADDALNRQAVTADEVLTFLASGFSVEQDSRLRFISYLIDDFYCFGSFTVIERQRDSRARITATTNIDYYRISIEGRRVLDIPQHKNYEGCHKTALYNAFRKWLDEKYDVLATQPKLKRSLGAPKPPFKRTFSFQVYAFLYGLFLSEKKRFKLKNDPELFFEKARHPISRFGAWLFGKNG